MSVTGVSTQERTQYLAAVEKLATSHVLHGSESLCKLLRYLAEHCLQNPGVPVKEYQIATEVFGRPADFDPHLDSAIRVQAGRLRVKLGEYYASEGAKDPVVVEMPKGTYSLSFHVRPVPVNVPVPAALEQKQERSRARHILFNWSAGVVALSLLLAAGVAALMVRWENRSLVASPSANSLAPAVFRTFWGKFVSGPAEPWVVFSNAAFVGRPETGMRYRNPAQDAGAAILDHYTGVGEVLAVHELDRAFHLLNREVRVKRGSLFSLDDAKNNNLIFVGSPAENLSLRDIPMNEQFVFQRLTAGARKGDLVVANLHAQAGEPAYFIGTESNVAMSEDYAVVALMQGINPSESVLMLAGTSTIGTQAAVEYVCHDDTLTQLLSRLHVPENGELKPFEVVLHVRVARGVPVGSEIVAVRSESVK
jgi:hypothetical protein